MITPDEIRVKALKLYELFIRSWMNGEKFFPKEIPSNKGKSSDQYVELNKSITLLMGSSKNQTGYGYLIVFKNSNTRKHGIQSLPEKIIFETEDDFLLFIDKKKDFTRFKEKVSLITEAIPSLNIWINDNINFVLQNENWSDLLKVCIYFKQNYQSKMYIRELPIEVHTKFIENNYFVLKSLLDYLLPENAKCENETSFEKRYYLQYDEPVIRFRLLDNYIDQDEWRCINDLSIPISSFAEVIIKSTNVFIIENKKTFLTFPRVADSIVIWGKGFNVESLKNINWLKEKSIYYWGDIDIHGYKILAQVQQYFPRAESILMDHETYELFKVYAVEDPNYGKKIVFQLPKSEKEVYEIICSVKEKSRLEQERITLKYTIEVLLRNNFKIMV